jgi:glycosyltransferase involved in cell wall biosynthesis
MNILFVDQFGQLGGAQHCLLDLLPAFQQRQWQLQFAIADKGPFPEKLRSLGMQVDVLPGCVLSSVHKPIKEALRYLHWYPEAIRALRQLAAEVKPDLLYVNGPRLLPPVALYAKRSRTPLIFHAHNRLLQTSALWSLGAHLRFGQARVIACCRYVADSLGPYVSSSIIETVYNGVRDLKKPGRRSSGQFPVLGVVGRIEPEKGQLEFVRAARLVHRELPGCRFIVIGAPMLSGSDAYFRQTIAESHALPVTFTGWQNDISHALRELNLLVIPSLSYDATPRVVVEAFSAGVPVLAFASGGIPELIEDGRTGFLVHTRSPEALASRMLEVLRAKDDVLAGVARNARQKWVADFRLETYQDRICNIITEFRDASHPGVTAPKSGRNSGGDHDRIASQYL